MLRLSTETSLNFPDIWVSTTDVLEKDIVDTRVWFLASFKQRSCWYFRRAKYMELLLPKETFNTERFCFILSKIAVNVKKRFIIVCDNSKIQVASRVKRFLNEHKLCMVSIPVYWPYVNPCTKFILIIKNRVRMLERKGTQINLRTFKKIIDKLTLKEFEECIAKSLTETPNLII